MSICLSKYLRFGLPALLLALAAAVPAQAHPRPVDYRQYRQQVRIYNGVRQGQIGPYEYRNLQRRAWEIELQRRRYRWNDGYISPQERYRLNRRLDRLSNSIYYDRRD